MNTDDIMSQLMGMIPLNSTTEIIELWASLSKLSVVLNEVIKKYPILQDEALEKACEEYAYKFVKEKFPHHIKEIDDDKRK